MEMNLQTIYWIVGIVGLVLAAGFTVTAGLYFWRVDIRAVRADLSGKARQMGLSERVERRSSRGAKNALTKEDEWKGQISHGDLAEKTEDATTASGCSDDLTYSGASLSTPKFVDTKQGSANEDTQKLDRLAVSFVLVKSVVATHSPWVIDAGGNEVEVR